MERRSTRERHMDADRYRVEGGDLHSPVEGHRFMDTHSPMYRGHEHDEHGEGLGMGPGPGPGPGPGLRHPREGDGHDIEGRRLDHDEDYIRAGGYLEGGVDPTSMHHQEYMDDFMEQGGYGKGAMDPIYNIIPVHDTLSDHPALQFPEVRAAIAALQAVGDLRIPFEGWVPGMDLMDWLGLTFGFQEGNVKNQREHLVLLLANSQMRLQPPPDPIDKLVLDVVRRLRQKVTKNYLSWTHFLHLNHNLEKLEGRRHEADERKELMYTALYFLIWGEAANLRFMPECLCFIFHNLAGELNKILMLSIDEAGQRIVPASHGVNGFLRAVIYPIYEVVQAEAAASGGGAPHSGWRNYDDMNEYFWSKRCMTRLGWPLAKTCNYLVKPAKGKGKVSRQKVGKTGFVEQRSFWNVFRSFDRLWVALILLLQVLITVAFEAKGKRTGQSDKMPWTVLSRRDSQAHVLAIFITWSALRVLQALLDFGMQYSLISAGTIRVGIRMILKLIVASVWVVLFSVYYGRMWAQRHRDRGWTSAALERMYVYLGFCLVFIAPEVLAVLLFIIPYVRNAVETSNWRIFAPFTWWFQSKIFVGRGLREGFIDNLKYTLFWIPVLLAKICFSYWLQVLPLVKPTRATLDIRDGSIDYKWHEFFKSANRMALLCVWAPVMLIYFMDMQIWYSLFSALVGALVGLLGHLGEIRDSTQIRSRFRFFPMAVVFNMMPEEGLLKHRPFYNAWGRLKNAVRRIKLRFGVQGRKKDAVARSMEVAKFKQIWNEIIGIFREEDIISNEEVELLQMPTTGWNISVTQWPLFLLSNEVRIALRYCDPEHHHYWYHGDKWLWRKISSNEYRRCAVIECYESLKHLMTRLIRPSSDDAQIFPLIFKEIDNSIQQGLFMKTFKMRELPNVHEALIKLTSILMRRPLLNDLQEVVDSLQSLYEILVRDFPRDLNVKIKFKELASRSLLFVEAVELPNPEGDDNFFYQLKRLHMCLETRVAFLNVPKSLEARRRISFFSNSIFMTMPRAPHVERMVAFSVLTPYYKEDVLYDKKQLYEKNEDGVSTLFYLQKIFPEDWRHFEERMAGRGIHKEEEMWEHEGGLEIRLWASYRGQTLVRTVRGMMYYGRALQKLAFLDLASEHDVDGHKELLSRTASSMEITTHSGSRHSSFGYGRSGRSFRAPEMYDGHQKEQDTALAAMKFTYVVACQVYGEQKRQKDPKAADILYLMQTYEALRVAYFDQTGGDREDKRYYSVLVKFDQIRQEEVEIYRVELPGPLILGEGKPENQNHALIFTRGDAIQTIDMNQENYFEEALKMRNLLQEFDKFRGIRKPTILGVREHVFTGAVSSLASFMSAQETSFVTLGQRVLANPLKVRMHYGHPDVFDRLWFLSRGGLSKASKVINISEDIYAGFNCTLRGGTVTHHEYIQVGKGRDVGLNQISLFEAKVASGNGEQMLSRDLYRLGHRLDFFRMLSVYYTTTGFFINNMIVVLTVYAYLWGRCYLAVSGIEESITGSAKSNTALSAALNQQFLVQMGILTALPMIVENSLERGFLRAIWEFLTMQLQLASVFFTFSMGTRAHYFGRTILHGGAAYKATGRGFVVRHEGFTANYQLYSRSHFVKGVEIILLLIVYQAWGASKNTVVFVLTTFSCWFLGITWIMAPFLFNPSGFDWLKSVNDFDEFMRWIWYKDDFLFVKPIESWKKWWDNEQEHFGHTGFWGKVMEIALDLRFFFFQYGIVYRLQIANGSTSIAVYLLSWTYILAFGLIHLALAFSSERYGARHQLKYRSIQALVIMLLLLAVVILFVFTSFSIWDIFTSLLAFLPTGWGLISICQVLRRPFLENTPVWPMVVAVARLYDLLIGIFVMAPVVILSWLPGFQAMQTRILFNEAFSRGLQFSQIVAGKM